MRAAQPLPAKRISRTQRKRELSKPGLAREGEVSVMARMQPMIIQLEGKPQVSGGAGPPGPALRAGNRRHEGREKTARVTSWAEALKSSAARSLRTPCCRHQ